MAERLAFGFGIPATTRDLRDRVVQCLDVQARHAAELLERRVGELDVPAHREVGAVELQHEARARGRLVFFSHHVGERREVLLAARVVLVISEFLGM